MPAPRGVFALLISLLLAVATIAAASPSGPVAPAVAWPPSSGFVLAEVMTGGVSASDEYVEIANPGPAALDLGGCELVYVTASGSTVTRKAVFASPTMLVPGQHLLVANSAGIYGPLADATYTGGLAADGGAVVLRRAEGTVVDAVGWGTASNSYVEGTVAPAPPATSSLERLPGGAGGNTVDTNDNKADWFVQSNPVPQSLASRPVPGSSPTPLESPTPGPSASASPTDSLAESPSETAADTEAPTSSAELADQTSSPGPTATASSTASPPPPATPFPSPTDTSPELVSIAVARSLPVGTRVHVAGVVTAESGLAGDGLIAIGDSSAGIFVRLSVATDDLTVGRVVEVDGTLAAPYGQLEVRDLKRLTVGEDFGPVSCAPVGLGDVGEKTEGSVVTISGAVSSVQTDSGRLTIEVTDGTTVVRVLADPPVGLSSDDVSRGDQVVVTGIVGQHASATGRLDGYRIWPRDRKDVAVQKPGDAETPEPLPAPTETSVYYDLASAVGMRGAAVDVDATVTATAGLLDIDGPTIVVDDGTAAVGVILPSGTTAPGIGMRVRVVGKIGRWEGGPTVLATAVESEGSIAAVSPLTTAGPLNGSLEWQLVLVCGRVDDYTTAGSRWRIQISVGGNEVVVLGEPAAGVNMSKSAVGRLVVVVGIVRRSTSDSSAFQLLPRMGLDVRLGPAPAAGVGAANGSARASGSSAYAGTAGLGTGGNAVQIASLSGHVGQNVTITGLVTQVTNATATVDDGTGQVRVGGSDAAAAISVLEPGDAVEVTGLVAQDSDGLIVEADPASLVDLPAGDSAMEGADAGNAVASGRFGGASSRAAAASVLVPDAIRRASSGGSVPPAGLALAAAVGLAIFGLAGALALTRYRRLPGGPSASR